MLYSLDDFNGLLKSILVSGHIEIEWYIDFINLFCVLNGVRNGAHLDMCTNRKTMYKLLEHLHSFPSIKWNKRWETSIWDSRKVSQEEAMNSWAYESDSGKKDDTVYWKNTGILLGNDKGYPTYSLDPIDSGQWSLNLTLNIDGRSMHYISMMGGLYDKSKADDLASVEVIKEFLEGIVGLPLFHPGGAMVCLDKVTLAF